MVNFRLQSPSLDPLKRSSSLKFSFLMNSSLVLQLQLSKNRRPPVVISPRPRLRPRPPPGRSRTFERTAIARRHATEHFFVVAQEKGGKKLYLKNFGYFWERRWWSCSCLSDSWRLDGKQKRPAVLPYIFIRLGGCIAQRKHCCFPPSIPSFESRLGQVFFSLQLSLWTVLRLNPSSDKQWISQMQLEVTSRAKYHKRAL